MQGNRYKISKKNRELVDTIRDSQFLGNKNKAELRNKDLFIYALSLGKDFPSDLEKPDQWFEEDDLNSEDKAIMFSIAYGATDNIDNLVNFEAISPVLDRMCNTGIAQIAEKINQGGLDNIEKRLIDELNESYKRIKF